jgi:hypothetical protein
MSCGVRGKRPIGGLTDACLRRKMEGYPDGGGLDVGGGGSGSNSDDDDDDDDDTMSLHADSGEGSMGLEAAAGTI